MHFLAAKIGDAVSDRYTACSERKEEYALFRSALSIKSAYVISLAIYCSAKWFWV